LLPRNKPCNSTLRTKWQKSGKILEVLQGKLGSHEQRSLLMAKNA